MKTICTVGERITEPRTYRLKHPLDPDVEIRECYIEATLLFDGGPPQPGRVLFPPPTASVTTNWFHVPTGPALTLAGNRWL